ncbi:MAG: UDP-3-O-(3-hydroxymyristoyl)glucosamine N-acyltransferase [Pyrinomonadaceae bacterium]
MRVREIAELLGGELSGDGETEIVSLADIASADTGQVAFFEKTGNLPQTEASCVLVPIDSVALQAETQVAAGISLIFVKNPKLAFSLVAAKLLPRDRREGWHETAVIPHQDNSSGHHVRAAYIGPLVSIGNETSIGEGTMIHDGARIGRNVSIGKSTVIHPNCVIYDNVSVGDDCVLHAGVVLGADGFGFVKDDKGEYHKFPQIGTVVIEDNVEIGAGSCVDRGALGETRIGCGTKIDNLVQVGHNVQIGKRCVIAAQTGISGSTVIEDDCVIGGQVGFGDHAHVKRGAIIGSQAGVLPGKIVRPGVWWGTPIQPLDEFKRQNAHVKSIGRLKDEVKALKAKVQEALEKMES